MAASLPSYVNLCTPSFFLLQRHCWESFLFPRTRNARQQSPTSRVVAARVLAALHAGRSYRPTGPALLSVTDMLDILSRDLERRVRRVVLPSFLLRKATLASGFDDETTANFPIYLKEHSSGAFAVCAPTSVVLGITGTLAESFETTARHLASHSKYKRTFVNVARAWAGFMLVPFGRGLDVLHTTVASETAPRRARFLRWSRLHGERHTRRSTSR